MSLKGKKAGMVISWQRSFSIRAPWRKGKGSREVVLDREVVLTKMKFFRNSLEKLLVSDDASVSTPSVCNEASEVTSHAVRPWTESSSDYLSSVFSDSQLHRLFKFESEDSGVELPSGADSPSTPTGSEQSFVVHSRQSSCASCNLNSEPTALTYAQGSEPEEPGDPVDGGLGPAASLLDNTKDEIGPSAGREDPHGAEDVDLDQRRPCGEDEVSGELREDSCVSERTCLEDMGSYRTPSPAGASESRSLWRSSTSDSLEEYMDECCKLSEEQQQNSGAQGSGLGYLDHICQLMKKIGHLQENNLRLQRQVCNLQRDSRMEKAREDLFQQYCSCGAASLTFQDLQRTNSSRTEFVSPSGTISDLSTIPEVSRRPPRSTRREQSSEGLWRRGLNRRSYTEGEVHFLGGSTDGLSLPQHRLSDSYTWGRVKDLVRKTKLRNQNRLGLTSSSLKMSCPQLYMPDVGSAEPAVTNRNSMTVPGHQNKLDLLWQQ